MESWTAVLVLLGLVGTALCYVEPYCPKDIAPCTCDGDGIMCNKVKDDDELRKVMTSINGGRYRGFYLQRTKVKHISKDMTKGFLFLHIFIEKNDLETIEDGAMAAFKDSAWVISVYGNKLISFPFFDLHGMGYLNTFNGANNLFTSIPEKAFYGATYLRLIDLSDNQISHIGSRAFDNINDLEALMLYNNKLQSLGPESLYMTEHSMRLVANFLENQISEIHENATLSNFAPALFSLQNNKMTSLPKSTFGHILDNLSQTRGMVLVSGNNFKCKSECRDIKWIVENKEKYRPTMDHFACEDGKTLDELQVSSMDC